MLKAVAPFNLDGRLEDLYLDEIKKSGAFRNFEVLGTQPEIGSDPLTATWGAFSLAQDGGSFAVSFDEPAAKRRYAFELRPLRPAWDIDAARHEDKPILAMDYISYPRLQLTGTAGRDPVTGEAWLDHQWGGFGWLAARGRSRRVLGWNWFGINLDDGSDLIVMVHRDANSRRAVAQFAMLWDANGRIRRTHRLKARPLRVWESRRTAIRYPVEWRIEIPEFNADLVFSPLLDNQEVPVFGPMRAIWEGAGTISGTLAGRKVQGRARCELQGYGYVFRFADYLTRVSVRIDRHIEEFLPKTMQGANLEKYVGPPDWKHEPRAYTKMLAEPVWDLVSRGGKRWRPIFAMLLLDALGGNPRPYEAMVCTLAELCHAGALIIDDIEDGSLVRRGDTCIHLRYGENVAINAANTLYFLPSLQIFNHPLLSEKQRLQIHEAMTRQYVRAHFGQALDLYWSANLTEPNIRAWTGDSLGPKMLQMYELKTAAAIEALAETAAIIAGSDGDLRARCVAFAKALGVAFQIVDDVRDFVPPSRGEKACGADLAEGKLTHVLHQTLSHLGVHERERLCKILVSPRLRADRSCIEEGVALVQRSGMLPRCQHDARALVDGPWRALAEVLAPSEPKVLLRALYESLLDVEFPFPG